MRSPQFPGLRNQHGLWPALEFDGTELVSGECSPALKTDNLAACSIKALFEGKVRLPLTEVRKGLQLFVDSMEGVAGERRRSYVDRLRVEELAFFGAPWPGSSELEKCSEGAGVFRRYGHEPLDFLAKLEEFESILVRLGLVGVGSGQLTSLAERYGVERGRKLREERKKKKKTKGCRKKKGERNGEEKKEEGENIVV
jgi:hypothetical protein